MPSKYRQSAVSGKTRFNQAPISELEFSTLTDTVTALTTFNAGDIVPVCCWEVLPHDTFDIDSDFVIRQITSITPVMGQLVGDFYAFFVPNRVVNKSWKNVMGQNDSGSWTAPQVSLATLLTPGQLSGSSLLNNIEIPVGSVADYYGFPTQYPIATENFYQMHDLKFRGYLEIYNQFFRDQNYQPPIPYSKLNVYNGFLTQPDRLAPSLFNPLGGTVYPNGKGISWNGLDDEDHAGNITDPNANNILKGTVGDGSFGAGAMWKELAGDGALPAPYTSELSPRRAVWSALLPPLKANKLHDWFTSVLPTPQKSDRAVVVPLLGEVPLKTFDGFSEYGGYPLIMRTSSPNDTSAGFHQMFVYTNDAKTHNTALYRTAVSDAVNFTNTGSFNGINLIGDLTAGNISVTVDDLRLSSSIQRVYELLGRGGSRYREFVNSFFNLEVDDPFEDCPRLLGHFRRNLDLYQTAQTSATPNDESGTPQGNLTAFGLTQNGGKFFHEMFLEHGYIHIMCVVRHRNVYSTYLAPDNFRLSMLDFYTPQLANISEQPVRTRCINPFSQSFTDSVFGYNEAWSEYRYMVDTVTGQMRPHYSQIHYQ